MSVHADDIISAASPNEERKNLEAEFWSFLEAKWPGIKLQLGPQYKHLTWNIVSRTTRRERFANPKRTTYWRWSKR